jgi:hypothetical protein
MIYFSYLSANKVASIVRGTENAIGGELMPDFASSGF